MMKDSDIVDIVAYHPNYGGSLVFRLRSGEFIKIEDYIAEQVTKQAAENIKQHFGIE